MAAPLLYSQTAKAITGQRLLLSGGGKLFPAQFHNFTGSNLSSWATALAAQKAGTQNAKIFNAIDSTTAGEGGTSNGELSNAKSGSYPTQLANLLKNGSSSSQFGDSGVTQFGNSITNFNYQIALGTGWATLPTPGTAGGRFFSSSSNGSGALAFTPLNQVDTVDIYWARGNGTFIVNVDGGSTLATINTAGSNGIAKSTVTFTLGTHTINIIQSGTTAVYIGGIDAYNSTLKEISVLNAGWCGSHVVDWASGDPAYGPMSALSVVAPNLTLVMAGINDWNSGTSLSTFSSLLGTIINTAKSSGSVILISGVPSQAAGHASYATQATYVAAMSTLAYSSNIPFIDMWNLFAGGTWEAANSAGLMYDSLHPNGTGYGVIAKYINLAISNPTSKSSS